MRGQPLAARERATLSFSTSALARRRSTVTSIRSIWSALPTDFAPGNGRRSLPLSGLLAISHLLLRARPGIRRGSLTRPRKNMSCFTWSAIVAGLAAASYPRGRGQGEVVVWLPAGGLLRLPLSRHPNPVNRPMITSPTVFLVDVDNTLIDNDHIQSDLKRHLEREFGAQCRDRYWTILEDLFTELGYRDYLGALQRYRVEHPKDIHLLTMSSYLVDYPFANRLYPGALDVLERFREWGRTVILSDGDVVFQPRKVKRSGIFEAVDGHVLIYIHKEEELDDVAERYPALHYVLVDDKPRILDAVKKIWGDRVTTVLPLQGQFALAADAASYPPADLTVERIGDLLTCDLPALLAAKGPVVLAAKAAAAQR